MPAGIRLEWSIPVVVENVYMVNAHNYVCILVQTNDCGLWSGNETASVHAQKIRNGVYAMSSSRAVL